MSKERCRDTENQFLFFDFASPRLHTTGHTHRSVEIMILLSLSADSYHFEYRKFPPMSKTGRHLSAKTVSSRRSSLQSRIVIIAWGMKVRCSFKLRPNPSLGMLNLSHDIRGTRKHSKQLPLSRSTFILLGLVLISILILVTFPLTFRRRSIVSSSTSHTS